MRLHDQCPGAEVDPRAPNSRLDELSQLGSKYSFDLMESFANGVSSGIKLSKHVERIQQRYRTLKTSKSLETS
jgi:hypothetical protein